LKYICFGPAS